jgi:signal peptidase II
MSGDGTGGVRAWLWGPRSSLAAAIAASVTVVDQAHKWWMILGYGIEEKGRVAVLPFFDLVYVLNTGISYSLLDGRSYGWQLALASFAVVASLAMWVWIVRGAPTRAMAIGLALIVGGAIGNAIDRVILGGVADFFLLHWGGWSWYVFNIADVAIVAGVAVLLYDGILAPRITKAPQNPPTSPST